MSPSTVFVVDDDAAVRDSLGLLLETAGIRVETCDSAEAFLQARLPDGPRCLVLDISMPGISGADLQAELGRRGIRLPIIFLTAHGDIPTTVRVMKAGAADFLTKPVDGARLLERVEAELARNRKEREEEAAREAARARLNALTEREREVLALAVAGFTSKKIAQELGISFRTVEVHRSHILLKTGATTWFELARLMGTGKPAGPAGALSC